MNGAIKLKKVGIITFHAAHNYGSVLQAYALQKIIANMGYKCEIINLRTPKQIEIYSILTKRKGLKYILKNAYHLLYLKKRKIRHRRFEEYISSKYILSEQEYSSCDELIKNPPEYDFYISGSDQIWNLATGDSDLAYFLAFVKSGKKIAYAPSFGPIGDLNVEQKEIIKNLIKDYHFLSIRENSGASLVDELIGEKIPVLIDPAMLLKKSEWDIISKPVTVNFDYIFFYTLFATPYMIKTVRALSRKLNLPVITPYVSNQYDVITNFIKTTDCGPCEFLSYIKNAKIVCTSSLHSTVFSILYEKPFFAIDGMKDKRINTLLTKTSLTHRAITLNEFEGKIKNCYNIDFSEAKKTLKTEKIKSMEFLTKALK